MIKLAKGAKRNVIDYKLSRYACYLIVMNGNPKKEVIALAQTYFAIQTRKQELIEERIEQLYGLTASMADVNQIYKAVATAVNDILRAKRKVFNTKVRTPITPASIISPIR